VDKECNVGAPCANRNRHSNFVPIPNGESAYICDCRKAAMRKYGRLTHMRSTIKSDADAKAK